MSASRFGLYGMQVDPRQIPASLMEPSMDAGHPAEPACDAAAQARRGWDYIRTTYGDGNARVSDYKIAKTLRVVREGSGGAARLFIDGEPFDYATVDGFTVHPKRNEMPGVTVTIAAWRVELVDDIDARPGELSPEGSGEAAKDDGSDH